MSAASRDGHECGLPTAYSALLEMGKGYLSFLKIWGTSSSILPTIFRLLSTFLNRKVTMCTKSLQVGWVKVLGDTALS